MFKTLVWHLPRVHRNRHFKIKDTYSGIPKDRLSMCKLGMVYGIYFISSSSLVSVIFFFNAYVMHWQKQKVTVTSFRSR